MLRGPGWVLFAMALSSAGPAAAAELLDAYVREGCPRCAEAKAYLSELQRERPGLEVRFHDVVADPAALEELYRLAEANGFTTAGVPAFHAGGRLVIGFTGAETTGREIRALLSGGTTPEGAAPSAGTCAPGPVACTGTAGEILQVPLFGPISVRAVGLPLFTVAIGLVDGFNPCAMWVLLFILSMLVNLGSRARMLAVAGTFVLVGGAVYFLFMAAWLNVFLLVRLTRPAQLALGAVAFAMAVLQLREGAGARGGPSLSIPKSAKPGIYARTRKLLQQRGLLPAVAGAAVLAALVNVVELLCTAGLPAMYTHLLAARPLAAWERYAYLALYGAAYILDDSVVLGIAVATLSRRKLQQRGGRALKLLSGGVLMALALLLMFRPQWLAF